MHKKKLRKSCKKNAQSLTHGSTIISKKDCDIHGVLGFVSHPEGVTQLEGKYIVVAALIDLGW